MFTGLIESTGTILSLQQHEGTARITIATSLAPRLKTGDSIAVNGVCLTALSLTPTQFSADLSAETLARTTLAHLPPNATVNLELPTPAGTPLGGHIVQGHVDATATVTHLKPLSTSPTTDWDLTLTLPPALLPYAVEKGSITIDGISLTIARLSGPEISIAVIPHTYAATNLHTLTPGAQVNIETDVLAKYAAQRPTSTLTEATLIALGY